ncbi:hypothetical protein EPUL_004909 [Erysiphe pulchra]|uniref:S-formylglutathione hydrolase n=1 Tax=Erysiphe pulchra TaxID=225359 RepID=A0A2S4PNH4_9PEZI|nr:hypothetical protein EPUL_004909 [Erysiphe pulchra]
MKLNLFIPQKNTIATSITTITTIETATSKTTTTTKFVNPLDEKYPVLIFLSDFSHNIESYAEKGFLQHTACQKGIAIVYPSNSPPDCSYYPWFQEGYGTISGASFYLNATESEWSNNLKMGSYIVEELPEKLFNDFSELDASRISIAGHGMGGHGALTLFLKNPGVYKSVSAFAPICNPINCPIGKEVFTSYLGSYGKHMEKWKMNDATELVKRWLEGPFPCLIDVGTSDELYLQKQLLPENFAEAANMSGVGRDLVIRYQEVKYSLA